MASTILVTGATGNVGSALIDALRGTSAHIVAAVRNVEKARRTLGDDIDYVTFDFDQPSTFEPALAGVNKLFLVRPPEITDVAECIEPLLAAAQAANIEQVVFLSLLGIEHNPIAPHYKIEKAILAAELPYTFLRPSFFMQNLNTTHRADIQEHHDLFVPAGTSKTSFIDVRDIGAVAATVLTEPGHINQAYDLTGSAAIDYYETAVLFTEVLGQQVIYSSPSIRHFVKTMRQRGTPLKFGLVMAGLYTTTRWGMANKVTDTVEQLLGRPPITMRQYINDYRDCWQSTSA